MNETILKFGYPGSLIADFDHWVVLLRPAQATLGATVLAAKSDVTNFADLEPAAFAELSPITRQIESALVDLFSYKKINYLMLMMVDPHVHFHVLPRYDGARSYSATSFEDPGWPAVPNLGHNNPLPDAKRANLLADIKSRF
jgi:diadenosine tetraphosphate (Ap4A) HIT family hydrolase